MRSGNPALNDKALQQIPYSASDADAMTLQGTVTRTFIMLALVTASAAWVWNGFYSGNTTVGGWALLGGLGGFVVALATIFKKEWSPVTAPIYAVLEGLLVGAMSAIFERKYPGIVIQAVALTFGTLAVLLGAYRSGLIRPTENFKLGVVAATGAIALLYIVDLIMGWGFQRPIGFIHESGTAGIIFSLVVVAIAALNLVLDFDFIERVAEAGAPKYMEWYGAFGLTVTLVWLYFEILRLLSKSRNR